MIGRPFLSISAVLTLALLLRFYQLGQVPISLNWDEVSNAYNAYSLLKTGRDEYGNAFPLTNRSFNDYKPPIYMYLSIPSIAAFGLNNFAARLPSAAVGVLSVLAVYTLCLRLFNRSRLSLLAAFMFAIAPWTVHFSRVGFEANVGLFFSLITTNLLVYCIYPFEAQKNGLKAVLFILGAIFAAISLYSYHSARVFLPIFLAGVATAYKDEILKFSKIALVLSIALGALITLPLFILNPQDSISARYQETTLKARENDLETSIGLIKEDAHEEQLFPNIIHNRRFIISQSTLQKYASHFDINFLFMSGDDNLRHHINNHGPLYFMVLPVFLFGLYISLVKFDKSKWFLFLWLIVAPIPASLGDAYPHAIRSYHLVVPIVIFSSIGLLELLTKVRQRFAIPVLLILVLLSLGNYLHNYFVHYNIDESTWWQFGYNEAALESIKLRDDYSRIVVDQGIEQAYIFWLFAAAYDPKAYQESGSRENFDKFYFASKNVTGGDLFIAPSSSFPKDYRVIKTIKAPNGTDVIKIGTI